MIGPMLSSIKGMLRSGERFGRCWMPSHSLKWATEQMTGQNWKPWLRFQHWALHWLIENISNSMSKKKNGSRHTFPPIRTSAWSLASFSWFIVFCLEIKNNNFNIALFSCFSQDPITNRKHRFPQLDINTQLSGAHVISYLLKCDGHINLQVRQSDLQHVFTHSHWVSNLLTDQLTVIVK